MNLPSDRPRIKLPLKFIDGCWEFAFGGQVPVVEGTSAQLVVDRESIKDLDFLKAVELPGAHKILPQGTPLFISVFDRPETPVPKELGRHLVKFEHLWASLGASCPDNWMASTPSFVQVALGYPTGRQCALDDSTGGLWLTTKGFEAIGIMSSRIVLPPDVSREPASSLNHALTLLSEIYEGWRISHTGNIYTRVLYRETDNRLYPLEVLRDQALAIQEGSIAKALWDKLLHQMGARPNAQPR